MQIPLTEGLSGHRAHTASAAIEIPQYRRRTIFAIWAGAALPMAALAWIVAPAVWREQRSFRWSVLREASAPRSEEPARGRVGGRLWLIPIPLVAAFGLEEIIPSLPYPASHDIGSLVSSHAGRVLPRGMGLVRRAARPVDLQHRALRVLPPAHAVGDPDRPADTFILAYPTKRNRSAWIGIAVQSAQSIVLAAIVLSLVI